MPTIVFILFNMLSILGNDYAKHTSCISEAEKYGGKDYSEKENANKGQKKQDLWLEKVRSSTPLYVRVEGFYSTMTYYK